MDMLEGLFEMQYALQKRLGYDLTQDEQRHSQDFFNLMVLATIEELSECLRETPWKPWKRSMVRNTAELQKELVDLWHFVINLTIAADLTPELLYVEFCKKNKINHERQNDGY